MKHGLSSLGHRFFQALRRSLTVVWLIPVAGYLMFLAGQAVYRNYQAQKETANISRRFKQAIQEQEKLSALLVYYRTDTFKEKELRRTLLLKKPGEKVYALPESSLPKAVEEEAKATQVKKEKKLLEPVWRQWISYLLNKYKDS